MKQPLERPFPERELLAYRAEFRNNLFRQIHRRLRQLKVSGFTQKRIAIRLGLDPGQLSKVLRGETDIRLETLADLARALGCRIRTTLSPVEQLEIQTNVLSTTVDWSSTPEATTALRVSSAVTPAGNLALRADSN